MDKRVTVFFRYPVHGIILSIASASFYGIVTTFQFSNLLNKTNALKKYLVSYALKK